MSRSCFCALALGVLSAGIASPQVFPADLQKYLSLTDAQIKSITDLNGQLGQYTSAQITQYYNLQSQANNELAKDSPDPNTIGDAYAQMEMIRRDYVSQLAQVQSKVGAVLTVDQAMLVNALLNVERMQPLVSEAVCVYLESRVPIGAERAGDFSAVTGTISQYLLASPLLGAPCQLQPMPTALVNYLNLTDAQIAAIQSAIFGNQDYASRQSLKVADLQIQIRDLTSAQTIDTAALGAAYVAIAQIQRDLSTQTSQLTTTVRSILTDQQQPQLQALDNALQLSLTAAEAVGTNILVLPPDLQCSTGWYPIPAFVYTGTGFSGVFGPGFAFPGTVCSLPGLMSTGNFSSL